MNKKQLTILAISVLLNTVIYTTNILAQAEARHIEYVDLLRMKLLEPQEIPTTSVLNMRSSKWKIVDGIIGDYDNDGYLEAIVAGTLEEPGFSESKYSNCFVKIMRQASDGQFRKLVKREVKNSWNILSKIDIHSFEGTERQGIFVTFEAYGSTYGSMLTLFISSCGKTFSFNEAEADEGPVEFRDLKGDGKDVMLNTKLVSSFPGPGLRIIWTDVYKWSCQGITLSNSEYPEFLKEQIHQYEVDIENAPKDLLGTGKLMQLYIEANRSMIDKAKRLLQQEKKK